MSKVNFLEIKNVKRVKHVVITPTGWVVKISGANAQGKSSTLDALMYLLEGKSSISGNPVRDGEKKGSIDSDFGEFRISRRFTQGGSYLSVSDKEGEIQSGQTFIDNLLGKNATDAMSFMSKKPADQRSTLARLSGADTLKIDTEIDKTYKERAVLNSEVERLNSIFQAMKFTSNLPEKEIVTLEVLDRLEKVKTHNKNLIEKTSKKSTLQAGIDNAKNEIARIEALINDSLAEISSIDLEIFGEKPIPEQALVEELNAIDKNNAAIRANIAYKNQKDLCSQKVEELEKKTAILEDFRKNKIEMIQKAKFPVPGLSLGDDCVLYNGHPLEDASGAEQILVGIGVLSEVIPEDGIRVLRVKNGSLIDGENMKRVEEMAERKKVQVWVEMVMNDPSEGDGTEIFIQDGQVVK